VSHLPCPTCQRHVRLSDTTCPFCATVLPVVVPAASSVEPAPRLGRIAVLAAGAAMMAGLAACDDPAQPKTGTGGAAATGGKGGSAGGSATGGNGGTAGASGAGGGAGSSGTGGAAAATGGAGGVPVAIYAAAVALPSNTA